eukprot:scaffold10393_cov114-Isochrysis_galbana.AAC.7
MKLAMPRDERNDGVEAYGEAGDGPSTGSLTSYVPSESSGWLDRADREIGRGVCMSGELVRPVRRSGLTTDISVALVMPVRRSRLRLDISAREWTARADGGTLGGRAGRVNCALVR